MHNLDYHFQFMHVSMTIQSCAQNLTNLINYSSKIEHMSHDMTQNWKLDPKLEILAQVWKFDPKLVIRT